MNNKDSSEIKIAGIYKMCSKLGKGSYGEVYQGINIKKGDEVAIKMEKLTNIEPMLEFEAALYKKL
jgi:serine/threonine protein kinase